MEGVEEGEVTGLEWLAKINLEKNEVLASITAFWWFVIESFQVS